MVSDAPAERSNLPRTYTWPEAIRAAAENNADLRAAENSLAASRAQEGAARAGFLPTVTGNLQYSRSGNGFFTGIVNGTGNSATASTDPNGGNTSTGVVTTTSVYGNYSATLSASENIFSGLETLGQIDQAKANRVAAEANYLLAKAQLSYDLKTAFESMHYADEFVRLTAAIVKRREENLRLVNMQFEGGRENRGSVLLSSAYRDQAQSDDLQARNAVRDARAALARAIGLDTVAGIEVTGEVPTAPPPTFGGSDATSAANAAKGTGLVAVFAPSAELDRALYEIARDTPTYRRAAAQEAAAAANVTIAQSGFFPSLGVSATYGRDGTHFFPGGSDRWSTAATLTLPFFNGGRDYYGLQSSIASRNSAERSRESSAPARSYPTFSPPIRIIPRPF